MEVLQTMIKEFVRGGIMRVLKGVKASIMPVSFAKFSAFLLNIKSSPITKTNSLGVALNCKLDDVFQNGKTLGYNENGDFKFGIFYSDLDAPALTQQNGSFTNYDKRVVPVKKALNYKGYYLSDFAKALSIEAPKITNLDNFYKNSGQNCRGFEIKPKIYNPKTDEFKIVNLNENLENFIYKANQIGAFSKFTNTCKFLKSEVFLYAGADFMQKFDLKEGDLVQVDNEKVKVKKDDEITAIITRDFIML